MRANALMLAAIGLFIGCADQRLEPAPAQVLGAAGPDAPQLSPPSLSAGATTQDAISVDVCGADPYGAPAGFSLQWESEADFLAFGWSSVKAPSYCAASFAHNANSRFGLGPNACESVLVGDFAVEPGASWHEGCGAPLACGTSYVFRTFAHANSDYRKSEFSQTYTFSTAACDDGDGCTYTQGYWKNHEEAWPVSALTLGSVSYTQAQLLAILGQPVKGNGLVSLAHQLIAAKLNVADGAGSSAVSAAIAQADALIGGLLVPPVGAGYLAPSASSALTAALDDWNNGVTGPGHCE